MIRSWSTVKKAGVALAALALIASPTAGASAAPTAPGSIDLRQLRGTVTIDGSSTVFPISEAMAEEFQKMTGGNVRVTVGISGTGGGFKKFCAGETDISDASRPISSAEIEQCKSAGIEYVELPVAFDGLSILVSPQNSFVESMTVSELKMMWQPEAQGTVTRWSQIRPDWPDREFRLYGPGADSGTFDYFTDAINGREKASRGDYTASEDDNVLVQGIANDADALGYFGFAYYEENSARLKLVAVDHEKGNGPVLPSPETIKGGTYTPLSRPLFIYAKKTSLDKPEVLEFLKFYLNPNSAPTLINQVGYIAFPGEYYDYGLQRLSAVQTGTVFGGAAKLGTTLADLYSATPSVP
jgi:phosphate transport system substrate-binding protein